MRSALKNRVHALLARHGVQHGYADLFGQAGSEFLAALELCDPPRRRLESLLALIDYFDREIEQATSEIDALASTTRASTCPAKFAASALTRRCS
jgi:hypothetical protein